MSQESKKNNALELLRAIVKGDAEIEDGLADLKAEGVSSLEDALSILKEEVKVHKWVDGPQPDFRKLRRHPRPEVVSSIKHVVPEVPFVLHGTWYEPQDITRFNGQELHFFTSPDSDHMLVVDDRDLMADWLQFAYFEKYRDFTHIQLSDFGGTIWYQDDNTRGWSIAANQNRGYWNLLSETMGFFGDWNDKISSFTMQGGVTVMQLSDDINFGGPFFYHTIPAGTGFEAVQSLNPFGWNDRASSCATW
ncbi:MULTISPECIES: hypothetical protein [unclassified Kitasatospora]|uniref:hypothetical protein n=1 Tax=unclassified Kitasatospora TaxID=2633591 RepID=UPI0033C0A1C7